MRWYGRTFDGLLQALVAIYFSCNKIGLEAATRNLLVFVYSGMVVSVFALLQIDTISGEKES